MKKQLFLIILITVSIQFSVLSQSESYRKKVNTLLSLNGTEQTFLTVIDQMILQFKQTSKDVPMAFWAELKNEFLNTSVDDLVELLVPIYHKHLTEEDLDGIIAFYNTDVGKKLAEKTPIISQESMLAGQQWGMKISEKIAQKMQERGY